MTDTKAVAGVVLKWTCVMAVGAAVGGYAVYASRTSVPAPVQQSGEDPSSITPGSDSRKSTVAETRTDPIPADPSAVGGSTGDVTESPPGQTGPDVDITVRPASSAPPSTGGRATGSAATAATLRPRRLRRRRVEAPRVVERTRTPDDGITISGGASDSTGVDGDRPPAQDNNLPPPDGGTSPDRSATSTDRAAAPGASHTTRRRGRRKRPTTRPANPASRPPAETFLPDQDTNSTGGGGGN